MEAKYVEVRQKNTEILNLSGGSLDGKRDLKDIQNVELTECSDLMKNGELWVESNRIKEDS